MSLDWTDLGIKTLKVALLTYDYYHGQLSYEDYERHFHGITGEVASHQQPHDSDLDDDESLPAVASWSIWSWLSLWRSSGQPSEQVQNRAEPERSESPQLDKDNLICCVCTDRQRNIVILPCRHSSTCEECTKAIQRNSNSCPICRGSIGDMIKYHNS